MLHEAETSTVSILQDALVPSLLPAVGPLKLTWFAPISQSQRKHLPRSELRMDSILVQFYFNSKLVRFVC